MPKEAPATGLEAMMGLDDMGELEIPEGFLDPGYRGVDHKVVGGAGGGGAAMTEEEMLAAAIQASLADMNLDENKDGANSNNQIAQESLDFLGAYAGGNKAGGAAAGHAM